MSALDRISELEKQGIPEEQISRQLQREGFSPKDIQDSMNQFKVKNAVTDNSPENAGMQPSIMANEEVPSQAPNPQVPMTQELPAQGNNPPANYTQGYPSTPEQYPPEQKYSEDYYYQQNPAYTGQEYYPQAQAVDTDTISEIAEQVFSDKFSEFTKKTGDLTSFRNSTQDKMADIENRLKRIEDTIDRLQGAIIGKIGEFGENSAMIHKDLENLHGTMSKLMNPLVDNYNELRKIAKG